MNTNNLLSITLKAMLTMSVALVIFTSCQEGTEDITLDSPTEELSDVVMELSADEIKALGMTSEEAAEFRFTQTDIENLVGSDVSLSDAEGRRSFSISSEPIYDLNAQVVGTSKLIRFSRGVIPIVITSGLTRNDATTLWLMTWNSPENCATADCGEADLFNPAAEGDALRATGRVVRSSRFALYATFVAKDDATNSVAPYILGGPAIGVTNPMEATVLLVVRSHGQVIPGLLNNQLNSYNGGCTFDFLPQIPELGTPGPNTCQDQQFTRHTAN